MSASSAGFHSDDGIVDFADGSIARYRKHFETCGVRVSRRRQVKGKGPRDESTVTRPLASKEGF